jgi:hypothetical protein
MAANRTAQGRMYDHSKIDQQNPYLQRPLNTQPLLIPLSNGMSRQWHWCGPTFSYYSADVPELRRADMGLGLSYSITLRPNDRYSSFDELGTKTTAA